MAGLPQDGSPNSNPNSNNNTTVSTLTPEQIAAMNAQTQAYQQQTQALMQQIQAEKDAQAAGPQLQYNPLNEDGTLKDQWKLGSADSYLAALKAQQEQSGAVARDAAAQQAQTGIAQSKENLAMRGGVGANNAALLEAQGMRQGLANQQAASNQTAQNLADIGVKGAQAQLGIDEKNLGTQLTAAQNVNAFNLDKYNQNMAVKASENQAKATEAAANSGGK